MSLRYDLELALRSFKRSQALTALMVLAIGLGIGAAMTTLTLFRTLSGDPMPGRSAHLYTVKIDARDMRGYVANEEPPDNMTRFDAEQLLREKRASRQALMTAGVVALQPTQATLDPFFSRARYASADFFPMFDTPFLHGQGWLAADDDNRARVVVLSNPLNQRLFAGADSTGQTLRINSVDFRVVGVLAPWRPVPHFYDLDAGSYLVAEEVYLPFSTSRDLKLQRQGTMQCWDSTGDPTALNAGCAWLQYWVQLDDASQQRAYNDYLRSYSEQQHAAGRLARPTNTRLRSLMEWLDYKRVVPSDVQLQVWLSIGFLVVCLVNTVGLLLAKCLRRSPEIGVRRALGATRSAIFRQFLVEAGAVGLVGGMLGLLLAWGGLALVRAMPFSYAKLAHLDLPMLLTTVATALLASLLAGVLPAWRACQVTPALQIKSQ